MTFPDKINNGRKKIKMSSFFIIVGEPPQKEDGELYKLHLKNYIEFTVSHKLLGFKFLFCLVSQE